MNSNPFTEFLYFYVSTGAVIKYLCKYVQIYIFFHSLIYRTLNFKYVFSLAFMIDMFKTA